VTERESLWRHAKLVERYVTRDADGKAHLKLDAGQRCSALAGKLGRRVRCEIYALRPAPCRRVEAGSDDCLKARRERGITAG
jgi:Fe-S-cluster containining protein